jgi:hypothetical protein
VRMGIDQGDVANFRVQVLCEAVVEHGSQAQGVKRWRAADSGAT